jgi:carbon monoxide dehydrogenase subunit G
LELRHEFDLPTQVDTCWELLLDLERVAPCLPGAEITRRVDDRTYEVTTKVHLGPVRMTYAGEVVIAKVDPAAHRTVMQATVKDVRGQGTARARIVTQLVPQGQSTHAISVTELELTGRVAQVGRGIVADVSNQLAGQFAASLTELAAPGAPTPTSKPKLGLFKLLLAVLRARLGRLGLGRA